MSRMYDRMLATLIRPPGSIGSTEEMESWRAMLPGIADRLRRCEVIVADNVAEFFYSGTDQEVWNVRRDFPCTAPPFEEFWVEWRSPSLIVSRESGVNKTDRDQIAHGILFQVASFESLFREMVQADPEEQERLGQRDLKIAEHVLSQLPPGRWNEIQTLFKDCASGRRDANCLEELNAAERALVGFLVRESCRLKGVRLEDLDLSGVEDAWRMNAMAFVESRQYGICGPLLHWSFRLDARGSILADPEISSVGRSNLDRMMDLNPIVFPALLTLSFMNCKNVKRVPSAPDPPLAKKYRKRTGRDLCRFWTLEIEPMRTVLRREGESEKTGLKKALHVCRGYFADYTDGKGLFGKYHGRYWVPNHMRGSIDEGVVDKVYAMKKVRKRAGE